MKFNSLGPQFEFRLLCIWHKHKFTLKRMMNEKTDGRTERQTWEIYPLWNQLELSLQGGSWICPFLSFLLWNMFPKQCDFPLDLDKERPLLVFHYLNSIKWIGIFSHITKLHLYVWIKVTISSSFRSIFFAVYVWNLVSNSLKGLQLRIFMGFFYIWNIERKKSLE